MTIHKINGINHSPITNKIQPITEKIKPVTHNVTGYLILHFKIKYITPVIIIDSIKQSNATKLPNAANTQTNTAVVKCLISSNV